MLKARQYYASLLLVMGLLISPISSAQQQSLYDRIGGYNAISAVVDDVMGRLANDPTTNRFLIYIPDSRTTHVRQMMIQFLCNATGGPCIYLGKDMHTAHKGMGLNNKDWQITVVHLTDTLNKLKVPLKEQQEVLSAVGSLKTLIVEN